MKSSSYTGFASNEYAMYETKDNGIHWRLVGTPGPANMLVLSDRIIYGSEENGGLTYSDDNGATRNDSNITRGNWNEITYFEEGVYAHSMDGDGIYVSYETEENGIGEIWEKVAEASPDATIKIDEKLYIQGNYLTIISSDGVVEDFIPNAKVTNGQIETNPINLLDGSLLVIINKFILPEIVMKLTGLTSVENFSNNILYNTTNKSFFSSDQLYYVKSSSDVIDFQYDVGMMPLSITIEDAQEATGLEEQQNTTFNYSEIPDTYQNTLDLIDSVLNIKKNYAIRKMAESIDGVPLEYDDLIKEGMNSEEQSKAIQAQNFYYNIQKDSTKAIVENMLESIYTFDNIKKVALLKSAIFETINIIAPSLNFKLKELRKSIANDGNFEVDPNYLNITYNFSEGLEEAIKKYLNSVFRNVRMATTSNDKDLIGIAVDKYKNDFRGEELKDLSEDFKQVTINPDKTLIDLESIEDLGEAGKFEAVKTDVNSLIENIYNLLKEKLTSLVDAINTDSLANNLTGEELLEFISNYDDNDLSAVRGYYKEIIEKFKLRVIELFELVYTNYKSSDKADSLAGYYAKKIIDTEDMDYSINIIKNTFINSWISMKELI